MDTKISLLSPPKGDSRGDSSVHREGEGGELRPRLPPPGSRAIAAWPSFHQPSRIKSHDLEPLFKIKNFKSQIPLWSFHPLLSGCGGMPPPWVPPTFGIWWLVTGPFCGSFSVAAGAAGLAPVVSAPHVRTASLALPPSPPTVVLLVINLRRYLPRPSVAVVLWWLQACSCCSAVVGRLSRLSVSDPSADWLLFARGRGLVVACGSRSPCQELASTTKPLGCVTANNPLAIYVGYAAKAPHLMCGEVLHLRAA